MLMSLSLPMELTIYTRDHKIDRSTTITSVSRDFYQRTPPPEDRKKIKVPDLCLIEIDHFTLGIQDTTTTTRQSTLLDLNYDPVGESASAVAEVIQQNFS